MIGGFNWIIRFIWASIALGANENQAHQASSVSVRKTAVDLETFTKNAYVARIQGKGGDFFWSSNQEGPEFLNEG